MAGLVWLASYPKSGSTWLRLLLANLLSGRDTPEDINNLTLAMRYLVSRVDVEDLTLIDSNLLTGEEIDRIRPALAAHVLREAPATDIFIKIHDAYRRLDDGTPVLGRAVARATIYILRDPRDVAVSLAHHNGWPVATAVRQLLSTNASLGLRQGPLRSQIPQALLDWSGHVRSWTRQQDVPVHVLRYEDLRADPVAVFGRVVAFLGLTVPSGAVEKAVRHADFTELQRQETENGFRERWTGSTAPFFRAGRAGGWVDVLTREQATAIEAAHGEVMAAYDYV